MSSPDQPVVLAVDDDPDVLETYELWLRDADLRTAADGPEALDKLDTDVDVILLDRMMSGLAGRDTLERIRDREGDWRVIMVTAVNPDFDLLKMDFDGYLSKPLTRERLTDAIDTVCSWGTYPRHVQQYVRARSALELLESTKQADALEASDAYAELEKRVSDLEAELNGDVDDVDSLVL